MNLFSLKTHWIRDAVISSAILVRKDLEGFPSTLNTLKIIVFVKNC